MSKADNITIQPSKRYPGRHDTPESLRLQAQHDLVRSSLGGKLILCPINLNRSNLRILDSGTADGFFLYDLWRTEIPTGESRETISLIGTDIAPYPELTGLPHNISLHKHDIFKDWPTEWQGSFDLVHQRAVMANTGTIEEAMSVVRRLIQLVKPGGWIQLVDGQMPSNTEIEVNDPASQRLFKMLGQLLESRGMDPAQGTRLEEILRRAGEGGLLEEESIEAKSGTSRLGKGEVVGRQTSKVQLEGLWESAGKAFEIMPEPPISKEAWKVLKEELSTEAEKSGIDMYWHAAWGRKKA